MMYKIPMIEGNIESIAFVQLKTTKHFIPTVIVPR